ncbi:unnamed protein product [Closterium sp. NIES-54]
MPHVPQPSHRGALTSLPPPSLPFPLSLPPPSLPFPLSLPPPSLPFPLSSSRPKLFSGQPIHAISSSLLSHPSTNPFPSPAAAPADVCSGAHTTSTSPTPPLLVLPPISSPTIQHPSPLFRLLHSVWKRFAAFQEPSPRSLRCDCCPLPLPPSP